MPYATKTVQTLIDLLNNYFKSNDDYKRLLLVNDDFYDIFNEAQDEIYGDCGYQPDNQTIDTVVDQFEYPIDGSANNFKDTVDEIFRVDYNGTPLKIHYLYPSQVIEPSTDIADNSGSATGWWEKWDDGKRILGLNRLPDEVVDLTIYTTRQAAVLSAVSGTGGVPAVEDDFMVLIKQIGIVDCYRRMRDYDLARAHKTDAVDPVKQRLREVMDKRQGNRPHETQLRDHDDYYN